MNKPIAGPLTGKSIFDLCANTLIISVGTMARPHGLSPSAAYQLDFSVIRASLSAKVNG